MKKLAVFTFACALLGSPAHAVVITKNPDQGPFWFPLRNIGTYVYANSFVASISGDVTSLGTCLLDQDGAKGQQVMFDVVGTAGGGGPDMSNLIATTGILNLSLTDALTLYSANTGSSASLAAGQTYWFAADVRGLIS